MSGNKANSPSSGSNETESKPNSPIRNAIATAALSAGLALSGNPAIAETTAQMDAVRNTCVAETKVKKESLLKLVEAKRAAGEMDKVAKLEWMFNKLIDLCVEWAVLEAKKTELDAKKTELDALNKAGAEISAELKKKIQMVDDFSNGKITLEEYQKDLVQLPQIIERAYAWLATARKTLTDAKSTASFDAMEKGIAKLSHRISTTIVQ